MGSDEEFATYMAARWPALMRSLIVLGCSPQEAEDVAQVGLARCYSSWDRVQRADDMDAYVYRTILNCWAKSKRRRWWGEQPVDVLPVRATPDPADATVTRHGRAGARPAQCRPSNRAGAPLCRGHDRAAGGAHVGHSGRNCEEPRGACHRAHQAGRPA